MIDSALELAKLTTEDPFAGIPEASELGSLAADLDLYYDDVNSLSTADRIDYARRAERAALDFDPRISNSEGGSFDTATGRKVLANSHGFLGEYQRSYCSVSAVPIARDEQGNMQRDYWYSVSRTMGKLESAESVGQTAAKRALRRLGARKVKTARVPVIFDPQVARSLLDHIFEAANGDSIYRNASFLVGKLGEQIAGENVTVIDDGTMVGGFGSSPFDSEGVPTRRTVVIERGVLKSYLLNTYAAKKLGLATTGNAARGLGRNPRHRRRQLLSHPRCKNPGGDHRRCQRRPLCDRVSRLWSQPGDRRFFPRRRRTLDLQRRAHPPGRGDHRRRQLERHAAQHLRNRQRSGVSRLGGLPHPPHRRHDRRRRIDATPACVAGKRR